MEQLLGLVLIAFVITAFALVPFIDLLFFLREKFMDPEAVADGVPVEVKSSTPIHDKLMKADFGTPHGGGIVLLPVIIVISALAVWLKYGLLNGELALILFSLVSFGSLGLIDDWRHISQKVPGKFRGLPVRIVLPVQIVFAGVIAIGLYLLGFNNIYLPIFGNFILDLWYIPIAMFAIVAFSNAYNISDGLDGLSTGLLTICLIAFLVLANAVFNPTLSIVIGVWIGALIAYLYFNVYPARIYLGDAGAFAFGATLAVVGLLTGKILGLAVIGGVYMVILASSFLQIMSKRLWKRKILPVAPIHMYFKYIGWPEPKIVARFWLAGAMCAVLGLYLALIAREM